jgi:hypothetical protein
MRKGGPVVKAEGVKKNRKVETIQKKAKNRKKESWRLNTRTGGQVKARGEQLENRHKKERGEKTGKKEVEGQRRAKLGLKETVAWDFFLMISPKVPNRSSESWSKAVSNIDSNSPRKFNF